MDGDIAWRFNANSNLVTANHTHRDDDIVANNNALVAFSREYQHGASFAAKAVEQFFSRLFLTPDCRRQARFGSAIPPFFPAGQYRLSPGIHPPTPLNGRKCIELNNLRLMRGGRKRRPTKAAQSR
jgi:hypothetical protein